MKSVKMLEFRRKAAGVFKRLANGEFLPGLVTVVRPDDPALNLPSFAVKGPGGRFTSKDADQLLYGENS